MAWTGMFFLLFVLTGAIFAAESTTAPPTTSPPGTGTPPTSPSTTTPCQATAPAIVRDLGTIFSSSNATVVLSVEVSGTPPLTYQWLKNGDPITGATGPTLTLPNVQPSAEGVYTLLVANCAGGAASLGTHLILNAIIVDMPDPGTVVNFSGSLLPPGLNDIVAISAGAVHALALRQNGTVAAWGNDAAGALGVTNVPAGLSEVANVCAGDDFSIALLRSGQLLGWGNGQCAQIPSGLDGVTALAAGRQRCLALKANGTVVEWGSPVTLTALVSDATAIAAAGDYTLVARRDGTVQIHGSPSRALSNSPTNAAHVAGDEWCYALTTNGTVIDLTADGPAMPATLTKVRALSARNGRYLALRDDGSVVGWGNVKVPATLTNVSAIAAGGLYCLALTTTPPAPRLSATRDVDGHLQLAAPIAVSGFALEVAENLRQGFTATNVFSGVRSFGSVTNPALILDATNANKFYRLSGTIESH